MHQGAPLYLCHNLGSGGLEWHTPFPITYIPSLTPMSGLPPQIFGYKMISVERIYRPSRYFCLGVNEYG